MKNKILIITSLLVAVIIGILTLIWLYSRPSPEISPPIEISYSLEKSRSVAEEWIKSNSPTYNNPPDNLSGRRVLKLSDEQAVAQNTFKFAFGLYEFHVEGIDVDEVMMEDWETFFEADPEPANTILVIVKEGVVIRAVVDSIYDELTETPVTLLEDGTIVEGHKIDIYFLTEENGTEIIKAVTRPVYMPSPSPLNALQQLLAGPHLSEKEEGYFSLIPGGEEGVAMLNKLDIKDGVAIINFKEQINKLFETDKSKALLFREQIEKTLLQFEEIEEIIITTSGASSPLFLP
jgi:hypothetical protein